MNDFIINSIKPHQYISAIQYANATGDGTTIDFFFSYCGKMFNTINKLVKEGKNKYFFVVEPKNSVNMAVFHRLLNNILNYYDYPFESRNIDEPFSSERLAYKINLTLYGGDNMNKHLNELNPKQFDIGQIVFFTNNIGNEWDWGVVDDIYSDGYAIALYELVDCRYVNSVPVAEYNFGQDYKKLPKGWNYDMDLINLSWDNHKDLQEIKVDFKDIDSIKDAIDKGLYVRPSSQDKAGYPDVDIVKDGYRIVWKHDLYSSDPTKRKKPDYAIVNWRDMYSSYEEAIAKVDAYNAELKRQAELSDYDWSLEQIDKALSGAFCIDDEDKKKIKQWLIDNTKIEDVAIRTLSGIPEWKYEGNKRWKQLDPSFL